MINLYFESNLKKDNGSIMFIPTFQIWWTWWKYKKIIRLDASFLFWDIGIGWKNK